MYQDPDLRDYGPEYQPESVSSESVKVIERALASSARMHRAMYAIEPAEPLWWDVLLVIAFVIGCYCLASVWDALP